MTKHYNDWYVDFINDAISKREKQIHELYLEKRIFEEERNRIIRKELGDKK